MRALAVGCGLLLALSALVLGLGWLFGLATAGSTGAENAVLAGSATLMALAAGASLIYAGARGGLTASRRRFGTALPLASLAGFLIVLGLGSVLLLTGPWVGAGAMPLLHFLAALLPALLVVGLAGLPRHGRSWRPTLVGLAYGGCGATLIALALEGALVVLLLAALIVGPTGSALGQAAQDLMAQMQGGALDPDQLLVWLRPLLTPATVGAVFLLVGLFGPLIEELAKGLGVALADPASEDRAWLWGVTIGAGFGVAEALTFGAMGMGLPDWPLNMAVRAVTTLMHATMGGLGGLGVYALLAGGARRRGLAFLALAWVGHAAWNSGVLLATLASVTGTAMGLGWSSAVGALAGLAVLALFALVVITFARMSVAVATASSVGPASAPALDEATTLEPAAVDAELPAPVDDDPEGPSDEPPPPDIAPAETVRTEAEAPDGDAEIPGLGVDMTWRPPAPDA